MKYIILNLFFILSFVSCVNSPEVTDLEFENDAVFYKSSGFYDSAFGVLDSAGCFACHSTGSPNGNLKDLKTENDWAQSKYIEPGNADKSLLILKIKNSKSNIATMPPTGDFSQDDFLLLKTWINHIEAIDPPAKDDNTNSDTDTSDGNSSTNTLVKVNQILKDNGCITCHSSGYEYGDFSALATDKAWIDSQLIVPSMPSESLLVQKLKNSGLKISTMPPAGEMSEADFDYIKAWIAGMNANPSNPPSSGTEDQYKILKNTGGIEQFLFQMKKLFFIENNPNQEFWKMTNNFRGLWGGGCDFFEVNPSGIVNGYQVGFTNPIKACDNKTEKGPVGKYSIIKAGSRINMCEFFTNSTNHMNAFYSKGIISGKTFNKDNAAKMFAYFYPTLEFTDEIYNNFVNTAKSNQAGIESNDELMIKLFLSSLCQSIYWEIF